MARAFNTDILDHCLQRERIANENNRKRTLQQPRRLLPQLAEAYGVREAYVFGSLTKPYRFRKNSDIDIAILGLKKKDYFTCMAALRNQLAREVDIIELEQHPWREKILARSKMEKEKLTLFEADFREQLKHIEKVYRKIAARKKAAQHDPIAFESLAYQLHNLYSAYEDLFKTVAQHFENHISDRGGRHKELLKRMGTNISGIRPALLSSQAHELLEGLRGFRHVFRHAYLYELDPERVKLVYKKAQALKKIFVKEGQTFLEQLRKQK